MMKYIAALDYAHLDNGLFLTALAKAISEQHNTHPILVHGDSAYTERIMQTGVMREEATRRSIKDLNHRLIALLADQGISAVGVNGYQRKLITRSKGQLSMDTDFIDRLPEGPVLLISTLVWDEQSASPHVIPLAQMVAFLQHQIDVNGIYAFSKADEDEVIIKEKPDEIRWNNMPDAFADKNIPEEFKDFNKPLRLSTARDFQDPVAQKNHIFIH